MQFQGRIPPNPAWRPLDFLIFERVWMVDMQHLLRCVDCEQERLSVVGYETDSAFIIEVRENAVLLAKPLNQKEEKGMHGRRRVHRCFVLR